MYTAKIQCQNELLDVPNQKIFLLNLICYEIKSVKLMINGILYQENEDFSIEVPFIKFYGAFKIENDDSIVIFIDYFYKRNSDSREMLNLVERLIQQFESSPSTQLEITKREKRAEIFVAHFISANFSLDNGLYKEAVMNFGTCVEVILNTELKNKTLNSLIANSKYVQKVNQNLDSIRNYRNKIHVNKLDSTSDITRKDAEDCKNKFSIILGGLVNIALL